jgi:hypothetical protein
VARRGSRRNSHLAPAWFRAPSASRSSLKTAIVAGLERDAGAQAPEKLHRELAFMCVAGARICLVAAAWFFVDLPFLRMWTERFFIRAGAVRSGLP